MFNKPAYANSNTGFPRKDASVTRTQPSEAPATSAAPGNRAGAQPGNEQRSNENTGAAQAPETAPVAKTENASEARLIVGPDVKLKGAEILDCDTLIVEGRVEATMDSRVIRIAEAGAFTGKVSIDIAEIHGSFEGELTARKQLIVHTTGRVSGKIRYGKLVIDEGGELRGDVNTLGEKSLPQKAAENPGPALAAVAG